MNLINSIKCFAHKGNAWALIYLAGRALMVFAVGMAVITSLTQSTVLGAAAGIGLMLAIGELILSPAGERRVRKKNGCREITDPQKKAYLMPLFREVYDRAKQADPSLPDDIQLFCNEDKVPNGFATGRKTICLTEGMTELPPDMIRATLAHEFGHLSHRDTDLTLLVATGGALTDMLSGFHRITFGLTLGLMKSLMLAGGGLDGFVLFRMIDWIGELGLKICDFFRMLRNKIVTMMLMHSSRAQEFAADAFARQLGYGGALCDLLGNVFGHDDPETDLFAILARSHPQNSERIARLQCA